MTLSALAQQALENARLRTAPPAPKSSKRRRSFWSDEDIERLQKLYADTPMAELMSLFGRPACSIHCKAQSLGLNRSDEFMASEHACRLRQGDKIGEATQFKPGQVSWNKGISFSAGGRSPETRFKQGSLAHNNVPVGTERVTRDGIRQRKTRDDGPAHRRWKSVHMIMWEEVNGEVPRGHIVIFKDKNTQNIVIENLELVTRAEHMLRNTIHRYPPELKTTIRQLGKLKRAISEVSNEK